MKREGGGRRRETDGVGGGEREHTNKCTGKGRDKRMIIVLLVFSLVLTILEA